MHTRNPFQQLLPKREDLPFWERINLLVSSSWKNHPLLEGTKFILSLCMLLVFGALKNVSFSNNIRISKFLQKVLKIYFRVFFPVQKICYQVESSAHDCIYTSHSGSFILTFTTKWQIMVLLFHMKQILTLVMAVFCWTDIFVRWFEDYQLPTIAYGSNSFSSSLLHMFQLSHFEWEAPVLRGLLQTCSSLKSLVLRWSWLKYWIFMNFSSRSHFLQTQCENLGS